MKIFNRLLLRIGVNRAKAIVDDNYINSGVEVDLCPLSGDAEVWESGKCRFKAYIENYNDMALVGLIFCGPAKGP